jgi:hypothetical protein
VDLTPTSPKQTDPSYSPTRAPSPPLLSNKASPPPPTNNAHLKLADLVEPTLGVKLVPIPDAEIKDMWVRYKHIFGMEPSQEIEPSDYQLSAVRQMHQHSWLPCVDFSVFEPHERRALKRMTYASHVWDPDRGTNKRVEFPEPSDFEAWHRS